MTELRNRIISFAVSFLSGMILIIFSINTCQRFEPKSIIVITTDTIEALAERNYKLTGTFINLGEEEITQHGFCWGETRNPTTEGQASQLGKRSTKGSFSSIISNLTANSTYYFRAYVITNAGTEYGDEESFTTPFPTLPILTSTSVSNVTEFSAQCGGNITDDGGDPISVRGVCWSTSQNPTVSDNKTTDGSGVGSYTSNMTGLSCGTTYYMRAYATNSAGTAYGSQLNFTTSQCPVNLPTVTTTAISNIEEYAAQSGGNVTDDGGDQVTARGVCWSTSQDPTTSDKHTSDGSGAGSYISDMMGLECGTTYYVRAYATNSSGTAYGSQLNFTTNQCPANLPTVTTAAINNITETSASSGGNVTDNGGLSITARGVCWSIYPDPTTTDDYTTDGSGLGSYTSDISGLECGTTYYVRAYATNSAGTAYGSQLNFSTSQCPVVLPTVTTAAISNITEISAQSGGNVTDDGGASVTARGICWSTSPNPTTTDDYTTDGTSVGSFTSNMTGLSCGTTYYVRAYATNSAGTAYGSQLNFNTNQCPVNLPTVTTAASSNITETTAQSGGNVTDDGGASITARGVCWSTSPNPTTADDYTTDGTGVASFTSNMTGLSCETFYYVRAYATNSAGTAYGSQVTFTTSDCIVLPSVTTTSVSNIGKTSAESGGTITDDGGAPVTARGVCWSTSANPTLADKHTEDGTGTGSFTSLITSLAPNTTYYIMAYATNTAGTQYGSELSFKTVPDNVTDFDGNVYQAVVIGDQVWITADMNSTHYSDGTPITRVEGSSAWAALEDADKAYCWYLNNPSNGDTYGAIYTWAAAMNGSASSSANPSGVQGVCPDGWHVPSDAEWKELEMYLGMSQVDADNTGWERGNDVGSKMKEAGTDHWQSPNIADNSSGFTALPGGYRSSNDGDFLDWHTNLGFWSATEDIDLLVWDRGLENDRTTVFRGTNYKNTGFSVRCLMD